MIPPSSPSFLVAREQISSKETSRLAVKCRQLRHVPGALSQRLVHPVVKMLPRVPTLTLPPFPATNWPLFGLWPGHLFILWMKFTRAQMSPTEPPHR